MQVDEKVVWVEERLADTLAADDQIGESAAARPGLGDEVRSQFGHVDSSKITLGPRSEIVAVESCVNRGTVL